MSRVRSSRRPRNLVGVAIVVALVAAVVGVVVVGVVVWSNRSKTPTSTGHPPEVPSSGLLFGAAVYPRDNGEAIRGLELSMGRTLAIQRVFSRWDTVQPAPLVRSDAAAGRVTLLSIRPQLADGKKISWSGVSSGHQDGRIKAQIDGLKRLGQPILLAFHHEADLSKGFGTPGQFRAAFRHYVTVARATGETNISFVVILTAATYGSSISAWYPGDDVVDWAGADAYNFGACAAGRPAWRSFAQTVASFRDWGSTHHKPLLLAEWGSAEDPNDVGRKARWITDAGVVMSGWSHLRAVSYFDGTGSCDWKLNTSTSAQSAYRRLARSVLANGEPTAALVLSGVSAGRTATWRAAGSTGSHHITGQGVTRWSFDPGDGTGKVRGSGQPPTITHTYAGAGTYSATLTVRDAAGMLATTHTVTQVG